MRVLVARVKDAAAEIRAAFRMPFSWRSWRYRLSEAWHDIAQLWRFPVAERMNAERPRRYCWSNLVMWAMGYDWDRGGGYSRCVENAKEDGCCFCGAIQCPAKLRELGADPNELRSDTFV